MINYDDIKADIKAEIKKTGDIFIQMSYFGKKIALRDDVMKISLIVFIALWIPVLFSDSYDLARLILTIVYNCVYWPILVSNIRLKRKSKPIQLQLKESMKLAREMMDKYGLDVEDLD